MKKKVLFLCTGNSCRSQMAEAIVNARQSESWQAYSAGTKPTGYVHPKAIQVLSEIGIFHTGTSKHVNDFQDEEFTVVITVCDSAVEECPIWLGKGKRWHHSFEDPATTNNIEDFRKVRNEIEKVIMAQLNGYKEGK